MTADEWIALVGATAWVPGGWGVWQAWRKRAGSKRRAADEGDRLVVKSALELLAPLESQLAKAQAECEQLRAKVRELTAEVNGLSAELEHQRQLTNKQASDVAQANRAAAYWRSVAETRAGEGPP